MLPRELIYFYLVAPILLAPVFQREIFELELPYALRSIAGNYLPFTLIPLLLHLVYRGVRPAARAPVAMLAIHAAISGAVALAVGLAIHPLFVIVVAGHPPLAGFVLACVVLTWLTLLPALAVEELRVRAAAAREAALEAQLDALAARVQPHFLFNALNTIASLVRDQPDLAERTIERLADLLRYSLRRDGGELVPLHTELAMMRDYLEVQRARFGDRLRYAIEAAPELEGIAVPPLVLQPVIENAVLHGIAVRDGGGSLRVAVRRSGDRLELVVEDDGPGPGNSPRRGAGTGLHDLRRRLALLYGAAAGLTVGPIGHASPVGCRVALALPVPERDA